MTVNLLPSKACILGALSQALDLVEGQPEGHALRTSRIALRLGRELGCTQEQLQNLFFAGVLKDSGCSNNSVRIQKIFGGDEFLSKRAVKFINWSSALESVKFALQYTEKGNGFGKKVVRLAANIGAPTEIMNEMTEARCTRGAQIARMLGLSHTVSDAIQHLDEHWDGRGAPQFVRGPDIPHFSRILCLAQTFEVFLSTLGFGPAYEVIAARSKKWFDPEVVKACKAIRTDTTFWEEYVSLSQSDFMARELPELEEAALEADIDSICEAFAMIIDAKSSFTAEHSSRVTSYSVGLAKWFGLSTDEVRTIRRAGLLHDIGKLGVSTGILEKPGKLDDEEFDRVKQHPRFSYLILRQIPSFEMIAEIASSHHERLDGRGYWQGLAGDQLGLLVRIVTACDVFDALTAKRPYRNAMMPSDAFAIMVRDEGTAFDAECLRGVRECYINEQRQILELAA